TLRAITSECCAPSNRNGARDHPGIRTYRLCPNPSDNDPAMRLTFDEDGNLPCCPMKYSGWRTEYQDLRDSDARLDARMAAHSRRLEAQWEAERAAYERHNRQRPQTAEQGSAA
ncbi:hypothetical protein PX554_13930, partial [Sphingomonas sp. H39-1-10]|uniref:hypothetical protein n=1 Tax=Sphingomonas pollutisoli TaxID=3030829 RepID=UPI0023BA0511